MNTPVLAVKPLGFPWVTADPFLFCAYHDDAYPPGNGAMGPQASLAGRDIGQDFSRKDGWSMYHGDSVPGFPAHPHRGFETGRATPLELFQIWVNLPARNKMVPAHFTMFWAQDIPRLVAKDEAGRITEVSTVAGRLAGAGEPLPPPPDSWAAQPGSDIAIWTIRMAPGAHWTLPAASGEGTRRHLYLFKGKTVSVAGQQVSGPAAIELQADVAVELANGDAQAEFLLLQGRPIGEPVAQYGPFVMNTQAEIMQAMQDYRRTQFGGWPWGDSAPVHEAETGRFARHPDGRNEAPAAADAGAERAARTALA
jgi:redox-sensitive bicupin YhaK (pirin superfamily)